MARVLILIGAHICTAPRPQKEAETLAAIGHDVTVRGFWSDTLLVERDRALMASKKWRFEPIIDFRGESLRGYCKSFGVRLRSRVARERYTRFGTVSPSLYGYGAGEMLKTAVREKADLTIVHSEAGMWVGAQLLDRGMRVGVDFEDWFSKDLLPEARRARPIEQLKILERRLMKECAYRLTTSHALADALAQAYDAPKPAVVYNVFSFAERENIDGKVRDRRNTRIPSLHWFSQTIGQGRGLETLFAALNYLSIPAEIHLRGACSDSVREWIAALVPPAWKERVFIHPTVSNSELLSRIAEHDVGLALEVNNIPSRNLTVTNKLFQYLQAGLAVIATDTAGQREILTQCPDVGNLIASDDTHALAQAVESLISNQEKLSRAKLAAKKFADETFCWERQRENLLQAAKRALGLSGAYSRNSEQSYLLQ